MDTVIEFLSAHPSVLIGITVFIVILILFFILKQFIKLALIVLLIALAAGGYYFIKDPDKMKNSLKKAKKQTEAVVDKSKTFYKDSKELVEKTAEVPGEVGRLMKDAKEKAGN